MQAALLCVSTAGAYEVCFALANPVQDARSKMLVQEGLRICISDGVRQDA